MQVQGTINGYGERCGNANLCSVIPTLELKLGQRCLPEGRLKTIADASRFVAEVANLAHDAHLPYVGTSAFAHKGGIHVAAMRRTAASYQHVDPDLVGNQMRVVVSRALRARQPARQGRGVRAWPSGDVAAILEEIKALEARGFSFEARRGLGGAHDAPPGAGLPRRPSSWSTSWSRWSTGPGRGLFAEAMVKVRVDGEILHTAAEGDGPVDALDQALRKALRPSYPRDRRDPPLRLQGPHPRSGERDRRGDPRPDRLRGGGALRWSTVGASTNIIEASWRALSDAVEFGLGAAPPPRATPTTTH